MALSRQSLRSRRPTAKPSFKGAEQVTVPSAKVKPANGAVHLAVHFELPAGYKINALAPMRYWIEPQQPAGPLDRSTFGKFQKLDHPAAEFDIRLPVKGIQRKRNGDAFDELLLLPGRRIRPVQDGQRRLDDPARIVSRRVQRHRRRVADGERLRRAPEPAALAREIAC